MKVSPETHVEHVGPDQISSGCTSDGEKAQQELPAPTRKMKTAVLSEGYQGLILFGHLDPAMI